MAGAAARGAMNESGRKPVFVAGLGLAAISIWAVLAFWLFPGVLESAYRGDGFDLVTSALSGRDVHPLEHYLSRWDGVAREGLATLIGFTVAWVVWAARGMTLDRHWFAPGRLSHLGIARIVLVGLQLVLLIFPAVPGCSGCSLADHTLLAQAESFWYQPILAQKLLLAPFGWGVRPDAAFMTVVKAIAMVAGVLALAGLLGRASLLVFASAVTVLVANTYSYGGEYHHAEGLMVIALWALACSPCCYAMRLRIRRGAQASASGAYDPAGDQDHHPYALWPLRLMQWLLALTYFDAGVAKLLHADFGWFQPTTLAYYLARDGVMAGSSVGIWMSEQMWLLPGAAVLTVALEVTFFLAILIPRISPAFVLGMTALHVGIFIAQWAPFPQHVALLWVAFLPSLREQLWRRS